MSLLFWRKVVSSEQTAVLRIGIISADIGGLSAAMARGWSVTACTHSPRTDAAGTTGAHFRRHRSTRCAGSSTAHHM
jgi:hypothetical protein